MTKQNIKRRGSKTAYLSSLLSLILCVAMLVTTTFAWFTDTVTSGENQIIAGNLDLDVQYTTDGTNWNTIQGVDSLFDKTALWEPGHTEVVYLKVTNLGTLAFNYKLNVTPVSESGGINQSGASFKLSDYLVFGTVAGDEYKSYDRAGARAAVGETQKLTQDNLAQSGVLYAGASKYVTMVVYMPENVGNDANYKTGTTAPKITLGITAYAWQEDYEEDSFGSDYDTAADLTPDNAAAGIIDYDYFPQVYQDGQLVINASNQIDKGNQDDAQVTAIINTDGETYKNTTVTMTSSAKVEETPAAEVEMTVVPTDATAEAKTGSVSMKVVKDDAANATFTAADASNKETTTYDVSVTMAGNVKLVDSTLYKVKLFIGKNRTGVEMYHRDTKMTEATSGANNTFTYDATTGYVTMYVNSFSPFTAVYNQPVCAIGTTAYYTLAEAFAAAGTSDTVKLIKDIELSDSIVVEKTVTLDLNGKTITDKNWAAKDPTGQAFFYVKSGAKLVINDTVGSGKISTTNGNIYAAVVMTISGNNDESKTATLIVNGGTLCGYYYGIVTNGNRHNTDITVNGGIITGYSATDATSIYHPCRGKLTINGGTFQGYDGLAIKGGTINITDGKFIATGDWNETEAAQGSGSNNVGAALYIEGNYGYGAAVQVSGGEFIAQGTNGKAAYVAYNEDPKANLSITGGTFSSDPSAYVAEGYVSEENNGNFIIVKKTAKIGSTEYSSLNAALAAVKDGETIVLSKGIFDAETVGQIANVNGKTFTVKGSGKETIVMNGNGNPGGEGSCDYRLEGANVTFEDLTMKAYSGDDNYLGFVRPAKLTFKNVTFTGKLSYWGNDCTIDGCTFEHGDAYDYCMWTWGCASMTIKNTVFNTQGKAIKMYGAGTCVLNVENCTFSSNGKHSGADKPAIAIATKDYVCNYTINIKNCTQTGFVAAGGNGFGTALFGSDTLGDIDEDPLVVYVDGNQTYKVPNA